MESPEPSPANTRSPFRNQRLLFVMLAAGAALFILKPQTTSQGSASGTADPVSEALARGSPYCEAPREKHEGRPRIIAGIVPAGTVAGRVLVLDSLGTIAYDVPFIAGEHGCSLEPAGKQVRMANQSAAELTLPFPDSAVLALKPGVPYGVIIALPGGRASEAATFSVSN